MIPTPTSTLSRRMFVALLATPFLVMRPRSAGASALPVDHPEPRAGITGAKVLKAEQLKAHPDLIPLFDGIREYAYLADGIRCSCGCATMPDHRSLLSCFEDAGAMAMMCEVCQGQGQLVARRGKEGQSLAQIRTAINARYYAGNQ